MKFLFFISILFCCSNVYGQNKDSLDIMEQNRFFNEAFFKNIKGLTLPEFTAKDLNGITFNGKTLRSGQVTFLSFWSESCTPCIAETPNLNRLYSMVQDNSDIQFFSITWDSEQQVKSAIKKYDIRFPILITTPGNADQLSFERGLPTNMVLDKKGRVYSVLSGGSNRPGPEFENYWKKEIDKALNDSLWDGQNNQVINIPNNAGIRFIDSLSKIHSFSDLKTYFKGKTLYIDLWASWCLPCLKEFKYKNTSVDSFFEKHKIIKLYMTIDNPHAKDVWRKLVYEYQLKGYHLMAGSELKEEIEKKIYKNKSVIEVPRYVIVKNGKLVEINAFAPSEWDKLIKQLTEKVL